MMRKLNVLVLCGMLFFISCSSSKKGQAIVTRKFSPEAARSDLILAKKILEANHPSLYWYTSKDSIDSYFNSALNSITDSLTEVQVKNKVAWVVTKIRCGHTSVRTSKAYIKA